MFLKKKLGTFYTLHPPTWYAWKVAGFYADNAYDGSFSLMGFTTLLGNGTSSFDLFQSQWMWFNSTIAGVHDIRLVFKSQDGDMNKIRRLDYLKF
ncbi:MAG: hypothetical protein KY468_14415 [Armatimonadetes bacterium]|nr:hypothetical protein [Armatimonadota bacterium]